MLEALESAERFIFMEFFIINFGTLWDSILEILVRKRIGCAGHADVRRYGHHSVSARHYDQTLRELGLEVTVFNPYRPHLNMAMNNRDHRKIVVVDGNIGFAAGPIYQTNISTSTSALATGRTPACA